jgi:hypothetical protein
LSNTQVATITPGQGALQKARWDERQMDVLKRTLCKEATDDEIALLGEVSRATGADPFAQEVVLVIYNAKNAERRSSSFIFSCNFAAKKANAAGVLAAMQGPFYLDSTGRWHEVWLEEAEVPAEDGNPETGTRRVVVPPIAAKVVARRIVRNGDGSVARIEDEATIVTYKSARRDTDFWRSDPVTMLGVAARRAAYRKLDVLDRGLAALGAKIEVGEPMLDYRIVDGQAVPAEDRVLMPPAQPGQDANEPPPARTVEALNQVLAASGLSMADMDPVLTRPGEPSLHPKNFEPRVKRWFAMSRELGVLDLVAAADEARSAAATARAMQEIRTVAGEVVDTESGAIEERGTGEAAIPGRDSEEGAGAEPHPAAAPSSPSAEQLAFAAKMRAEG